MLSFRVKGYSYRGDEKFRAASGFRRRPVEFSLDLRGRLNIDPLGNLSQDFIGIGFFLFDRQQYARIIGQAKQIGPATQRPVHRNFVVFHLLASTDQSHVSDLDRKSVV